jgi:Mce-associated membrane protein
MPLGRPQSEKEPTDVPDDTNTPDEQPADGTMEKANEATESAVASAEESDAPTESTDAPTESAEDSAEPTEESESVGSKRRISWSRVVGYGLLPGLALLLALAAGFARWEYVTSAYGAVPPVASAENPSPATESMDAAKDSTIKMLSYKPDTVDQQLNAARDLLTGDFRDSYTSLINDVVVPGAQQKQISAVASVPAVASVTADPKHAVALVFVNQTVVVGQDPPSDTASTVRVTLEKVGDRWLISEFEPV